MRRARRDLPLVLTSTLLIAAGCRPSEPTPASSPDVASPAESRSELGDGPAGSQPPVEQEPRADQTDPGGAAEVNVQITSWADVEQLVERHRGQVVVIDVWSTWCVPCLREFPNLVQLQQQYGERVAGISVNIDYIGLPEEPPESFRERVLEFLRSQQASALTNVISSDADEALLTAVEVSSIPAVLVYDRRGQLRQKFTNDDQEYGEEGFTYQQHILPLIDRLLAE